MALDDTAQLFEDCKVKLEGQVQGFKETPNGEMLVVLERVMLIRGRRRLQVISASTGLTQSLKRLNPSQGDLLSGHGWVRNLEVAEADLFNEVDEYRCEITRSSQLHCDHAGQGLSCKEWLQQAAKPH